MNYGKNNIDLVFEHMATTNRLGVSADLIKAVDPDQSGKIGLIFLQLAQAMISHATEHGHAERCKTTMHALYNARSLAERIDRGIKSIEWDVTRGSTLKQAARSASISQKIAESTLIQAVHMRAETSKKLRRVEIDRLIEQGWTDELIAKHVKCNRATIWRHRKAIDRPTS